jgi:hypothetical protein
LHWHLVLIHDSLFEKFATTFHFVFSNSVKIKMVAQESISAPSTPTRPVAPAEEKAAMTASVAPEVTVTAKDSTSTEPAEAEKVAEPPTASSTVPVIEADGDSSLLKVEAAEAEKVADPSASSTLPVVEVDGDSSLLIVEAEGDKKSETKGKSPYDTILDLISVIEDDQRKHVPMWLPSCFDPCTSTAQDAANDELMKDAEIMEKENAKAETQAQVEADSTAEDASPITNEAEIEDDSTPVSELTVEVIGSLIQEIFDSDNTTVNAALDAFDANLYEDKTKCNKIVTVGGCHALVQLVKKCVAKAIENIPDHDQVTDLSQPELKTLFKALAVITNLTYHHEESQVGITVIGGVDAVVTVLETFPLCRELQRSVCASLCNLTCCSIGKKKALEAGGITALIAAVTKHTDSSLVCQHACDTLENMIDGSLEQTKVFMNAGGVAALSKVRDAWPENKRIQASVLGLSKLIRKEMKSWMNEE